MCRWQISIRSTKRVAHSYWETIQSVYKLSEHRKLKFLEEEKIITIFISLSLEFTHHRNEWPFTIYRVYVSVEMEMRMQKQNKKNKIKIQFVQPSSGLRIYILCISISFISIIFDNDRFQTKRMNDEQVLSIKHSDTCLGSTIPFDETFYLMS